MWHDSLYTWHGSLPHISRTICRLLMCNVFHYVCDVTHHTCDMTRCCASVCDVTWLAAAHLCVTWHDSLLRICVWRDMTRCCASVCDVTWLAAVHLCVTWHDSLQYIFRTVCSVVMCSVTQYVNVVTCSMRDMPHFYASHSISTMYSYLACHSWVTVIYVTWLITYVTLLILCVTCLIIYVT